MTTALVVIISASVIAHIWVGLWARRNWKNSETNGFHAN